MKKIEKGGKGLQKIEGTGERACRGLQTTGRGEGFAKKIRGEGGKRLKKK